MKRLLFLFALLFLAACTGTKGDHDPVAVVVATNAGAHHQLQLIETRSLSMGDGLVLHAPFTYAYPSSTSIVQLLAPDMQRRELWVLYSQAGNMYVDIFAMSAVSLAQPAPLQPTRTVALGAGNPVGFDVHGGEVAVTTDTDVVVFDSATGALLASPITIAPFKLPPVYLGSTLYYWSDAPGDDVALTPAMGTHDIISFGQKGATVPAVTRDVFDRERLVHLGSNRSVVVYDRVIGENPIRTTVDDLQTSQQAFVYGGRLLSVASGTLQQLALSFTGEELEARLVGRDSTGGTVIVPDPYNQFAYALRAGSGVIITTLVDSASEPDDRHELQRVQLPGLATPFAAEAFIVQGAP